LDLVPKFPKKKFRAAGNNPALTFWSDERFRKEKRPGKPGRSSMSEATRGL